MESKTLIVYFSKEIHVELPLNLDTEYQSAIARNLPLNTVCARAHCGDFFSVLSRARSRRHLEVLKSEYINVQRPGLCV